jgi:hypothetical protein
MKVDDAIADPEIGNPKQLLVNQTPCHKQQKLEYQQHNA